MRLLKMILRFAWFLSAVALLAGCATPIGIKQVSPHDSYRELMANPLTEGVASNATKIVLRRFNLVWEHKNDPAAVIEFLHDKALHDDRRDTLYALAELSYLYGERLEKSVAEAEKMLAPDYFLLASIYAYLFLLDDRIEPVPNAFDIRARTAWDLYNFALWRGMQTGNAGALNLTAAVRKLPVGALAITVDLSKYPWTLEEFERFESVDKYVVRGISIRNRSKGVGSALIGVKKGSKEVPFPQAVPTTVFLRINANLVELTAGTATASLEFYSAYDENLLEVKERHPPLETDTTTPAAYVLETSKLWGLGLGAFWGKGFESIPNGLHLTQPYRPGRIPVVFVHGTFSNPAWWAEMLNTLRGDPILQQKFQFWAFLYNSSAPIVVSAADLRDALSNKVAQLDPKGKDPALREMVVVGHSQGGLLSKLTVVDTGDSLVLALTGKNLESQGLPEDKKAMARQLLVVEPVPEVKRVVFISTPHRGSILSKQWVRTLIKKIVTLPIRIVETTLGLNDYFSDDVKKIIGSSKVPTSIDSMSPDNPVLKTLADTPLAPGVVGHSIIAVKGEGDPKLGDDGVVAYTSAHLEGMASEFIVRTGHSSQGHPFTIEEVRRILLEHLDTQATLAQ
ncbi:MAG: pimeloyl-ACP methyl ester carboxylesterase [Desulforhopalus sp.]|jgi:pimeloyl-ACP methyl ester carboxylesterase